MGTAFWIRRFLFVFSAAWIIIAGAQLLKGHTFDYSAKQGLLWAAISATVFITARIYQSRQKQHCALCRDTPEMRVS
jgi:hypothetical protein